MTTAVDPIRLDRGNATKGTLHYKASFIPALAIKGVKFEHAYTAQTQTAHDEEDGFVSDDRASSASDDDTLPDGPTIKSFKKSGQKEDHSTSKETTVATVASPTSTSKAEDVAAKAKNIEEDGTVEMTTEELLAQRKPP